MRWCDIDRNGRPVYHGPVWRWYRSGKLEGKEYYINGDAAGVWPSYYENGHLSSLGSWENGHKQGLWKYWDDAGQLTTEVTYSESNSRTDYYASGQKKAVGLFTREGKIGKWTYWNRNGKEKAHCDFGHGVFDLPEGDCQIIANELDPKGYSLPIPMGQKSNDGTASVSIGSRVFKFSTPEGWIADPDAGRRDGAPLVFYAKGKEWKAAGANMYVRVSFKKSRSFEATVKDEKQDFEENVAEYHEEFSKDGRLPSGLGFSLSVINYRPLIETDSPFSIVGSIQIHEHIAYLDGSDKVVLLLVVTADKDRELQHAIPAFQELLQSVH